MVRNAFVIKDPDPLLRLRNDPNRAFPWAQSDKSGPGSQTRAGGPEQLLVLTAGHHSYREERQESLRMLQEIHDFFHPS